MGGLLTSQGDSAPCAGASGAPLCLTATKNDVHAVKVRGLVMIKLRWVKLPGTQPAEGQPSLPSLTFTVVMKNWEPFVLGPALAMERRKGASCLSLKPYGVRGQGKPVHGLARSGRWRSL